MVVYLIGLFLYLFVCSVFEFLLSFSCCLACLVICFMPLEQKMKKLLSRELPMCSPSK